MQFRKQQFELDMQQQTASKSGKEYLKPIYYHPCLFNLYAEYIMRNTDWMKLQDGQGNVVTSEQRPKGSEGRNLTEIWGKEHYRGKQQPVQRSWGGYTLDVFNKHERVLRRLGEQGG